MRTALIKMRIGVGMLEPNPWDCKTGFSPWRRDGLVGMVLFSSADDTKTGLKTTGEAGSYPNSWGIPAARSNPNDTLIQSEPFRILMVPSNYGLGQIRFQKQSTGGKSE
jgi:hypothetical protein